MVESLIDALEHAQGDVISPELEADWLNAHANTSAAVIQSAVVSSRLGCLRKPNGSMHRSIFLVLIAGRVAAGL